MTAGVVAGTFLLLSAWICFEALQVPLGSFRMPGAGFFPLVLGLTLGLLSILLFGMSYLGDEGAATRLRPERGEVLYLAALTVAAVWLFERAGFLITMALFLGVAIRMLGKMRWATVLVLALAGSAIAYWVFGRVLLINVPSGILPF